MSIGCQEGTLRAPNIKYAPKSSVIQLPLHVTVNIVKFQTKNSKDNVCIEVVSNRVISGPEPKLVYMPLETKCSTGIMWTRAALHVLSEAVIDLQITDVAHRRHNMRHNTQWNTQNNTCVCVYTGSPCGKHLLERPIWGLLLPLQRCCEDSRFEVCPRGAFCIVCSCFNSKRWIALPLKFKNNKGDGIHPSN